MPLISVSKLLSLAHGLTRQFAKAAIDEAIKAGVRHISYSSLAFASNSNLMSVTQVMVVHLLTEQYLDQVQQKNPTTFSYTAVREGLYLESYPIYTAFFDINNPPQVRSESPTMAPVLASHEQIIILSGPCAYMLSEMADIFSCILRKLIPLVETSIKHYVEQPQVKSGLNYRTGDWAWLWANSFKGIHQSKTNIINSHLRDLLGQEPKDFETTIHNSLVAMKEQSSTSLCDLSITCKCK
jgi:hypothetical protein